MTDSKACDGKSTNELTWDSNFSVGAPVLDKQHQSLFDMINQLRAACINGLPQDEILAIIQKLYTYSATHFKDEEMLLERKKHKLLSDQQTHHAIFLDYVIELEKKAKLNVSQVNEEVLTFLNVWWEEHILKVDMQYRKYFSSGA